MMLLPLKLPLKYLKKEVMPQLLLLLKKHLQLELTQPCLPKLKLKLKPRPRHRFKLKLEPQPPLKPLPVLMLLLTNLHSTLRNKNLMEVSPLMCSSKEQELNANLDRLPKSNIPVPLQLMVKFSIPLSQEVSQSRLLLEK